MALSEILLVIAALAYLVCGVGIVKVLNAPEAVAPAWLRTVGLENRDGSSVWGKIFNSPRTPWAF